MSVGTVLADGLNERGLNVNLLYLSGSDYGSPSSGKPVIYNLRMAEFVLDQFATVEEAIAGLAQVQVVSDRILDRDWGLHLSLADRSGRSAVVEFIAGRMVVHQGNQTRVMTNEPPLAWQLNNLKRYRPFGGDLPLPGDVDPASRFVRASTFLSTLPKASSAAEAEGNLYGVMKNVAVPAGAEDYSGGQAEDSWVTLWTVIANLDEGSYAFQLARNPYPIWVELKRLNFGGGGAMRRLYVQSPELTGDVSERLNRSLLNRRAVAGTRSQLAASWSTGRSPGTTNSARLDACRFQTQVLSARRGIIAPETIAALLLGPPDQEQ